MASLYTIQLEYVRIMDMIEDAGGEITDEINEALQALYEDKDNLIDAICETIVNYEGRNVAIKMEVERLTSRAKSNNNAIEKSKDTLLKVLKHFNMKSTSKGSKGYAFKTALFSGHSLTRESVEVDEFMVSNTFRPINGKQSKFVKYTVATKFDFESLKKVNELGIVPYGEYAIEIDKKAITQYLKDVRVAKQIEFTEDDSQIKFDPITELARLVSKESLVIK
jgi:hypothetical protein